MRFATDYLTLKSIHECKPALKRMFVSREWRSSKFFRKGDVADVEHTICYDSNFWKGVQYFLKCVLPFLKVLRLVDDDLKPAMGYVLGNQRSTAAPISLSTQAAAEENTNRGK